ncbi:MAG: hypothetical protein HYU66_14395 [Armatimonadetes bacterium]|nr:hypothetical protein [Armatimonadota bacterium]
MSISFTGLAWHAPLDVFVGWYLVRQALSRKSRFQTFALACGIGLFYGLWAVFWWNEPPPPMKALFDAGRKDLVFIHFTLFAVGTTVFLALAHWLYQRTRLTEFKPSRFECWVVGVLSLLYYALVTVPAAPRALWVLPPLMGLTLWALARNRRAESRPDAIAAFPETPKPLNYLLLLVIPLVASMVYLVALATGARLHTNMVVYTIATPLGALLWIVSVVMCARRRADTGPLPEVRVR